jgi:hypothetical protein
MKFEIKNNKIYRRGEEIKPDTSGTNGKVVSGMSAHGLWFSASTSTEKITIYKNDIKLSLVLSIHLYLRFIDITIE